MPERELISIFPPTDRPRHAQQEIADLLTAALLRRRAQPERNVLENSERVRLGFCSQRRVNDKRISCARNNGQLRRGI
ncbi:MAG: hypothetical protein LBO79_01515 [Zoogloeaceae bacterium]|jgi:hypothetical protein|nr:hypothetical protein [Zoogloeaceae bacterium]